MTRTTRRKVWAWAGAVGLVATVALLATGCGDEVTAAKTKHIEGPSLGLHRPRQGGFGGCGECPCERNGKGLCGVCHLFQECVYCDTAAFCPKDPCGFECPTSDHGPGKSECPGGFPNDCNDGTCCPDSHPQCCGDGRCAAEDESCD